MMFRIETMHWKRTIYGTNVYAETNTSNQVQTSEAEIQSAPIWDLEKEDFEKMVPEDENAYLNVVRETELDFDSYFGPNKEYNRKIENKTIIDTDFLVIHIERANPQNIVTGRQDIDEFEVYPMEKIKIKENKYLYLLGGIMFDPNRHHYTAFFKCGNSDWFYYDDIATGDKFQYIGTRGDNISEWNNGALIKRTTHLFYGERWLETDI